jgi:hypothetical protein
MFEFGGLERMEEEVAVAFFKVLSQHLPEGLMKSTKTSKYFGFQLRIQSGKSETLPVETS